MSSKLTFLIILAATVAAIVVFLLVTREEYGDPAQRLIEREAAAKP